MTAAAILLAALIAVGGTLYLFHRRDAGRGDADSPQETEEAAEECCGMHITCERDSLLSSLSERIEYYDDEELDAYRGRGATEYSDEEVEQFRDVLLTLLPDDIAGWARSIQLRGITLPAAVRDELLMIVSEARRARSTH